MIVFPKIKQVQSVNMMDLLTTVQPMSGPVNNTTSIMNRVTVNKVKLLAIIRKNRAEHVIIVKDLKARFREDAEKEVSTLLLAIQQGHPFNLTPVSELVEPTDRTTDYDRAILMLSMSVDKNVMLSAEEFSNYVQDIWSWSRHWAASNMRYASGGRHSSKLMGLSQV